MPSLPLFYNPTAGRGRAGRHMSAIGDILASSGFNIEPVASEAPGDIERLVAEAANEGAKRVIVAGGDGSIHEAVNGVMASGGTTELGVVPIGTGNDFAKASSLPTEWEHGAALLADRLQGEMPSRPVDIGRCNDRYFANGAGIGFDAKVSAIARGIRWPIGDLVYLVAVVRAMIDDIATPHIEITAEDEQITGPITLASVSNGPWVGGMFHIAPAARNDDGHLDLVIADPVTRTRIVSLLPKIMSGKHIEQPEVKTRTIRRATLIADAPVPSHLDGEVQPLATHFEFAVLSSALHLI